MYLAARVITLLFNLFTLALLLRVLGSWLLAWGIRFPHWAYDILHVLDRITSPLLNPIRRAMPTVAGLDLSPIIAVIFLQILERLLISVLL